MADTADTDIRVKASNRALGGWWHAVGEDVRMAGGRVLEELGPLVLYETPRCRLAWAASRPPARQPASLLLAPVLMGSK